MSFKNRFKKTVISLILILSVIMPGAFSLPAYAASYESLINDIFAYEMSLCGASDYQQLIDNYYAKNAGRVEWSVYSLIRYKSGLDYSEYSQALLKHAENTNDTAASREKYALIFGATGYNKSYIQNVCNNDIGKDSMYMSYVFGLHLLNNGYKSNTTTADEIINTILKLQLSDGGWDISNRNSDVDVTAMTLQALAPYYRSNSGVKASIDKALTFLSSRQLENGGYKSYGKENPESCAQVIVALCSLGINPEKDERFIKNGKSSVDNMLTYNVGKGQYSHVKDGTYNYTATTQVLYSLISLVRFNKGQSALYQFNKSTSGTNTTTTTKPATTTQKATTTKHADESVTAKTHRIDTVNQKNNASTTKKSVTTKAETSANAVTDITEVTKAETTTKPSVSTTITKASEVNTTGKTIREIIIEADDETTSVFLADNNIEDLPVTDETAKEEINQPESHLLNSIKIYIISGICALALALILLLLIKRNKKAINYITIIVAAAALSGIVIFANIQTNDEFYNVDAPSSADTITATISIRCDTVAGRGDESITPSDGIILDTTEVTLSEGATVYDCLIYVVKENHLLIEDNTQTMDDHSGAYIAGINNLYEFDYGNLSGWMYSVNGSFADVGCGEYVLKDGDNIEWQYTCNIGEDLK